MSKRVRNDEEERDSPFPLAKKPQDGDGDDDDEGEGDIPALMLLDGPVTKDEYLTALLRDSDSDLSFFSYYGTNDEDGTTTCATMLSSYVTINGNDETCGSSYSDWSSSVMAGFSFSFSFSGCGVCTPRAGDESGGVNGFDLDLDLDLDGDGDEDDASLAFLNDVLLPEQQ